MLCRFLVYKKDGVEGNDLTAQSPYQWLNEKRVQYPKANIVVLTWMETNVPQGDYDSLQSKIGIDFDESKTEDPKSVEPVVEKKRGELPKVKRPRGWQFMAVFVDLEKNVFHKGVEQPGLKGTLPVTVPKE